MGGGNSSNKGLVAVTGKIVDGMDENEEVMGTEIPSSSVEARRLQTVLAAIGKTIYHEKVLASVNVDFLASERLVTFKGKQTLSAQLCHTIVEDALKEALVPEDHHEPIKARLRKKLPLHIKHVSVDDLMYLLGQCMCKYNSFMKARLKFDELDADGSGYLDGPELNKVVDWMLQSLDDIGMLLDRDEEEIRMEMLDRIDADKDERLSFEEFLILFEEEQRKALVIKYARQKFQEFDVNESGALDGEEIVKVVDWLLDLSEENYEDVDKALVHEQLLARVGEMQEDNTVAIPIAAFMKMCEEEVERLELRRRARDKFKELDTDKSGYLDNEELHKVVNFMYHTLGHHQTSQHNIPAAKRDLMQRVDANGDGKLDCAEFIELFEQLYLDAGKPLEAMDTTLTSDGLHGQPSHDKQ